MASTNVRNLAEAIGRRFRPLGGVKLRVPGREPMREPPKPAGTRSSTIPTDRRRRSLDGRRNRDAKRD